MKKVSNVVMFSPPVMNKNSQHESQCTSQDGFPVACTRWQSCGPARAVAQLMNDSLCVPALQTKSTESFLAASVRLVDTDVFSKIPSGLPMYPFSGSEYPIGRQLPGIRTLIQRYRQAGIRNISNDLCEGGQHEMPNELNRGQVRTNILLWLSSVLHDQSRNREVLWPR
jgi:alpha-beta hydrolase superfamily lysophospholipase